MSKKIEFNKIPQIKIGEKGEPGRAFGGLIYSSNLDVGVNGDPTKLSLNIVPDDDFKTNEFAIKSKNLSDQNRQTITIGNDAPEIFKDRITGEEVEGAKKWTPLITMENMILTSYNKTKSVEDKILSVTYVDGSVLLDKVYVGLINQHYQTKKENEHEYEIFFDALCNSRYADPEVANANIPKELRGQCDGRGMELISTMLDDNFEKTKNKEDSYATEEEKKIIYGTPEDAGKHWAKDEDGNIDLPEWVREKDTGKVDKKGKKILFTGAKIKRKYLKAGTRVEKIITAEGVFTGKYKTINYQIFIPSKLSKKNSEVKMVERAKESLGKWTDYLFDGALVVLGREEFKESVCDASMDVSYSFTDLLNAMKGLGIVISKAIDEEGEELETDSLFDRNNQYLKPYSGTLREVLQQWCSDFGFGFYWDYSVKVPTIVGADLTEEGRVDLDDVEKKIIKNESGAKKDQDKKNYILESSEENVSLEETYQQVFVSQYLKGSKQRDNSHKSITQDYFSNVDFMRLLGVGDETNRGKPNWNPSVIYRTAVEFMISCGLAKYNDSLRDVFNMRLAISHSQKPSVAAGESQDKTGAKGDFSKFLPLGITGVIPISWTAGIGEKGVRPLGGGESDLAFLMDTLNIDSLLDTDTYVAKGNGIDYITNWTYFIGVYDASLKAKFIQLEKMVAEFWGKLYRTGFSYNAEHWECSNSHKRAENVKYNPDAKWGSWYEEHTIDGIKQILQSISNIFPEKSPGNTEFVTGFLAQLQEVQRNLEKECKKSSEERNETGFYYFNRPDATWGTQAADVDGMLTPFAINIDPDGTDMATFTSGRKETNIVNPYVVKQTEIPGLAKAQILSDPNVSPSLRKLMNSSRGEVGLFVVPGLVAGTIRATQKPHGIAGKPYAVAYETIKTLQNKPINIRDLGQVVITNSKLGSTATMDFRNKYPCFSGTDKGLTYKSVDCTGGIDDFKAPGYHPNFVTRNTFEELKLVEKLCRRDREREAQLEAECKTICERTLLQDACGKCAQDEIDFPDRFTKTMLSTKEGYVFCDSFSLERKNVIQSVNVKKGTYEKSYFYSDDEYNGTVAAESKNGDSIANKLGTVKIIFPSRNAHGATRLFSSDVASISKGSKLVIGGNKLRKNSTRRLKFLEKNITSDLEQFYEGQASGTQQIVNGMTPWDADKVRAMFLSTDGDPIRAQTLQEYHDFLEENLNLEVLDPQRTLSFKLVMGKILPSEVSDLLTVRNGLNSLSYSLGADGFSLGLDFNNKPPALMELGVGMRNMGAMLGSGSSIASMR